MRHDFTTLESYHRDSYFIFRHDGMQLHIFDWADLIGHCSILPDDLLLYCGKSWAWFNFFAGWPCNYFASMLTVPPHSNERRGCTFHAELKTVFTRPQTRLWRPLGLPGLCSFFLAHNWLAGLVMQWTGSTWAWCFQPLLKLLPCGPPCVAFGVYYFFPPTFTPGTSHTSTNWYHWLLISVAI